MTMIDVEMILDSKTEKLELNTPHVRLHMQEIGGCVAFHLSLKDPDKPEATHVWMDREHLEEYADAFDIVSKALRVWIKRNKEEEEEMQAREAVTTPPMENDQ